MSDADRLVQAAEKALIDEAGDPEWTSIGRVIEGRLPDLAVVAAAAVLRELAADEYALICERTDGLYALKVNLHDLADEIEEKSGV
jgi:hypothetical protein